MSQTALTSLLLHHVSDQPPLALCCPLSPPCFRRLPKNTTLNMASVFVGGSKWRANILCVCVWITWFKNKHQKAVKSYVFWCLMAKDEANQVRFMCCRQHTHLGRTCSSPSAATSPRAAIRSRPWAAAGRLVSGARSTIFSCHPCTAGCRSCWSCCWSTGCAGCCSSSRQEPSGRRGSSLWEGSSRRGFRQLWRLDSRNGKVFKFCTLLKVYIEKKKRKKICSLVKVKQLVLLLWSSKIKKVQLKRTTLKAKMFAII